MVRIVSDSCKCSACLHKYSCPDWRMVSAVQGLAAKFFEHGRAGIQVVFLVEDCEYRKTRGG